MGATGGHQNQKMSDSLVIPGTLTVKEIKKRILVIMVKLTENVTILIITDRTNTQIRMIIKLNGMNAARIQAHQSITQMVHRNSKNMRDFIWAEK